MSKMRPHHLLEGTSFGPAMLKIVGEAYDRAWTEVVDCIGTDPKMVSEARRKLATAILSVAAEGNHDVASLKAAALQALALDYRRITLLGS